MALIDVVKRRLGYENADEIMEETIKDSLEEGKSFLLPYDPECDFESPTLERKLLIEFVRYDLSNASDDFPKNYQDQLIRLSNRGRVKAYAASQEEQIDPVQPGEDPVSDPE